LKIEKKLFNNESFCGRASEPPADCQDCMRALDWCAEYRALNHLDRSYSRGSCHDYIPGRKGFEHPWQCPHCGTVYPINCSHEYEGDVYCCRETGHKVCECSIHKDEFLKVVEKWWKSLIFIDRANILDFKFTSREWDELTDWDYDFIAHVYEWRIIRRQ